MTGTSDIWEEIDRLSAPQIVECASFCLPTVLDVYDSQTVHEQMLARLRDLGVSPDEFEGLLEAVSSDRESYEELLRICLLATAEGPAEEHQVVKESIEGVGRNAFEIVVSSIVIYAGFFLLFGRYVVRPIIKDYIDNPPVIKEEIEETEGSTVGSTTFKTRKIRRQRQPLPLSNLFDWISRLRPSLTSQK
jgi:hypothetical protein